MKKIKALALFSGGLDSTLAIKLIKDQGIEVIALNFTSPLCLCNQKGRCFAPELAKKLNVPIKMMNKGKEYLKIIKNPKFGYGSEMNPCIDCRIFILKKAKKYAKPIKAKFIFTGEVLDQRPMSQHRNTLMLIEKEAGLKGKLLRPLSAKLLPETEAEKKGWVNRNKLLAIRGRRRIEQFNLAKKFNIVGYPCPSGGCLLTQKAFAKKLKDLFEHNKKVDFKDIELLKIGRHFRYKNNKIIVGRNEEDNKRLLALKKNKDYIFEVPNCGSPITLLQGNKTKNAIKIAAELTAAYSDAEDNNIRVIYNKKKITVKKLEKAKINATNVAI